MFTQEDLQELLRFESEGNDVVSIYLNCDSSQVAQDAIRLQLRSLLKEVGDEHAANRERIESYFQKEYDWSGAGLAIFSSMGSDFFKTYQTAIPFNNRIRVSARPYVKPIVHLSDYYAHYGVILVDRVGARFFKFHLGELSETNGTIGEDLRTGKQGGGSANAGVRGGSNNRQEDEVVLRNIRNTVEEAQHFFAAHPIRRLFIGGTNETVSSFRPLLSKQMQSLIGGTFHLDMNSSEAEVGKMALALLHQSNELRETDLIDTLVARVARQEMGVVGLDQTLVALNEGRVHQLIVGDGFKVPGYVSDDGTVLSIKRIPDIAVEPVRDLVDLAILRTMEQGGQVEVIRGNELLQSHGHIGAILRY